MACFSSEGLRTLLEAQGDFEEGGRSQDAEVSLAYEPGFLVNPLPVYRWEGAGKVCCWRDQLYWDQSRWWVQEKKGMFEDVCNEWLPLWRNHPQKEGNYFIAPEERGAVGFKFIHPWLESRPARPGYHIWDILNKGLQEKGPHLRRKGGLAWNLCPGLFRDCLVQALPTFSPSSQQLKAPRPPSTPTPRIPGNSKASTSVSGH